MSSNCNSSSTLAESSSGDLIFYLDGAHSPESMEVCARWFSSAVQESKQLPKLLSSSHDVEIIKEVWGSGYIQSERDSSVESNKISKKVGLLLSLRLRLQAWSSQPFSVSLVLISSLWLFYTYITKCLNFLFSLASNFSVYAL